MEENEKFGSKVHPTVISDDLNSAQTPTSIAQPQNFENVDPTLNVA